MSKINFKKEHISEIMSGVNVHNFVTPWQEDNVLNNVDVFSSESEDSIEMSDDFANSENVNEFLVLNF